MKRKAKKTARKPSESASSGLSAQHERFCHEYIVDYHQTKAALRAGYSEKSAAVTACRLLKKAKILARVRELQEEQLRSCAISKPDVIIRLGRTMRREEVEHVVSHVKTSREWLENGKKIRETVEVPTVVEVPTKVFDATKAAELLGKHFGLFDEQAEQTARPVIVDDIPEAAGVAGG